MEFLTRNSDSIGSSLYYEPLGKKAQMLIAYLLSVHHSFLLYPINTHRKACIKHWKIQAQKVC